MARERVGTRSEAMAADAIFAARRDLAPIAPIRDTCGVSDVDSAYRIQDRNTCRWLDAGRTLVGRKIGLTSKAVQTQLGVGEPDYGMLWGDLAFHDGDRVPLAKFMQPKIEAEIAFVMERDVRNPSASLTDLIGAIAYCLPAIEIVDSAIDKWNIKLVDTVADNASSRGFALGSAPRSIKGTDLRLCGMLMSRRGEIVSSGLGAACLGHPLNAAAWLARKMAQVGRPLQAGDIVLSGALGPMVGVATGDRVTVEIQGFDPLRTGVRMNAHPSSPGAAIITGGGYGIGRAAAELLAADGWLLVVVDRDAGRAEETCTRVAAAGGHAVPVIGNVADIDTASAAVARPFRGRTTRRARHLRRHATRGADYRNLRIAMG